MPEIEDEPQEREYRPAKLLLRLTPDEFNVMNWVRTKHRPARLYQWAIDVLVEAACKEVAQSNLTGRKVPQGVNEIVDELRRLKTLKK